MHQDLLYQLALTQVPSIGHVHAKILAQHFGTAEAIFKCPATKLEKLEGIGTARARAIRGFQQFGELESEIAFIEQYKIQPLFLTDAVYPQRLLHCYDPPTLLFYRGTANLNAARMVAVIGTRHLTTYGKQVTEKLVQELMPWQVVVVSGLATGVDAIAHRTAIHHQLPTVGVLAHGLDTLYPAQHTSLAREMIKQGGGLLTEYRSHTKPDKHHFPVRNRIVAGISDAIIVVETGVKGGSMITAELANGYHKDIFAVPGKISDTKSAGCNYLIKQNKAALLTDAQQLADAMGWCTEKKKKRTAQPELFHAFTDAEQTIIALLQEKENLHIDELQGRSGLPGSSLAAAILNLELQQIINTMPGKRYSLQRLP